MAENEQQTPPQPAPEPQQDQQPAPEPQQPQQQAPQDEQGQQPKISVDDDWKAQAQAEKQRLAKEMEQPGEPGQADQAAAAAAPGEGQREVPPASFATLVAFIRTQVLFALGGVQDRKTGRRYVDLELAKHHIDTLTVLEEKTRGNLTDEEKKLLDKALYEARMDFVQIAQRVVPSA